MNRIRIPTQHEWIDAIIDTLADIEQRKACGTVVLDIKDGVVLAAKFQLTERIKLTNQA